MKLRLLIISIFISIQIHAAGLNPAVADIVKIFSDAVLKYAFEGELSGPLNNFTNITLDKDGNYLINNKPCINFKLARTALVISTPEKISKECQEVLLDPSVIAISAGYYVCKPYIFTNQGWQSDESVNEGVCTNKVLKEFGIDQSLQEGFEYKPVLRDKTMNLTGANQSILMEFGTTPSYGFE